MGKAEDEKEGGGGGGGQACAKTREWSEQVGKADDEREGGGDETEENRWAVKGRGRGYGACNCRDRFNTKPIAYYV